MVVHHLDTPSPPHRSAPSSLSHSAGKAASHCNTYKHIAMIFYPKLFCYLFGIVFARLQMPALCVSVYLRLCVRVLYILRIMNEHCKRPPLSPRLCVRFLRSFDFMRGILMHCVCVCWVCVPTTAQHLLLFNIQ